MENLFNRVKNYTKRMRAYKSMQARKFDCTAENIKKLLDIFETENLLIAVLALHINSELSNIVLCNEEKYKVILPKKNTIMSETMIVTTKCSLIAILDLLVESDPRCITLCNLRNEIQFDDQFYQNFLLASTDKLANNDFADYAIAVIFEEGMVTMSINRKTIDPIEAGAKFKALL